MQKINFQDLPNTDTPYNANTFNTMQNNIEEAIVNGGGTLFYTNSTPNASFNFRTIGKDTSKYNVFEIYLRDGLIYRFYKTGKETYMTYANLDNNRVYTRKITIDLDFGMSFGSCNYYDLTNSTKDIDDNVLVPLYIVGYKTNLFN